VWDYRARLVRVHDGDTVFVELDQGLGGRQEEPIRLLNVHAPETEPLEPGAIETRDFVVQWMASLNPNLKWPLYVVTLPNSNPEPSEKRTFVRYLGNISEIKPGTPVTSLRSLNVDVNAFLAQHPEWGTGK
jgi:hypothetical protein